MRLKEIEARLAQIRNELNTRAAELTAEEITALETEVTDLQEERTQILEQAERRNNLLARIAAGESIDDGQGGEGAAPRVLRNFSGAAGEGDDGDKYGSMEYRKAFMRYVCLIVYSQSGCPAARQREKVGLLVSSCGERQELFNEEDRIYKRPGRKNNYAYWGYGRLRERTESL